MAYLWYYPGIFWGRAYKKLQKSHPGKYPGLDKNHAFPEDKSDALSPE